MADLDRIRARIRQLREMTTARGCTEAEALSAAAMALRLMGEHGISEDELDRTTSGRPSFHRRRRSPVDELWSTVATVCRCRSYADISGDRRSRMYYGAPADVAVAEYLHDLLLGAVRRATAAFKAGPDYRRRRKASTRAGALRGFQVAMVVRLRKRLETLWWNRIRAGHSTAEAEGRHLRRLDDELMRQVGLVAARPLKRADRRFAGAIADGWVAGGQVPIDPGVGAGERRLLG